MRISTLLAGLALLLAGCDWSSVDERDNPLHRTTWSASYVVHDALFGTGERWNTTVELQDYNDVLSGSAEWEYFWENPDPWLQEESVFGFTDMVEGEQYSGDSLRFALYTAPVSEDYDCDLLTRTSDCRALRPAVLYFFGALTSDSTMAGYGVTYNGAEFVRVNDVRFDLVD